MIEIPAFWGGVGFTLVVEILCIFGYAIAGSIKNRNKK